MTGAMKLSQILPSFVAAALASPAAAQRSSANYSLSMEVTDFGGGKSASADYSDFSASHLLLTNLVEPNAFEILEEHDEEVRNEDPAGRRHDEVGHASSHRLEERECSTASTGFFEFGEERAPEELGV